MSLKKHITLVALDLFSRNGIKRVSMDDVARKANVSKRTLYDFFSDKESLLIETLDEIKEPVSSDLELLEKTSATALEVMLIFNDKIMEKPTWLCDDFFEDMKRYPNAFQFFLEFKRVFLNKIIDLMKRGEREGVFMSNINYDIISLLAQRQMSKNEPSDMFIKYTREEVHNTIFFIFLRGICTDAGRDILEKFVVKKRYRGLSGNELH